MQWVPISQVQREMDIKDANEADKWIKWIGKVEGKIEVARKMLARKMSVSDIIDLTGLGREAILSLQ